MAIETSSFVDGRWLVHAIQPAKHILNRKQHKIRTGFDELRATRREPPG
jgi:hypothetical protein